MTGIERLRELAQNCRTASVNGYTTVIANVHAAAVEAIADQIEREGEEYDRRQSKRWTIVWWMVREMEQHVSGVEGMEDSPVAHWARELRYALKSDTSDSAEQQNPSCADPAEAASVTSDAAKVTRDPVEDVSMSAYDLLPQEERDAIAWVREHGGLDAVRASFEQGIREHGYLCDIASMLGTSIYDGTDNADDLLDKLDKRLMPKGMEWLVEAWPRFEDDAPVRMCDEATKNGENFDISTVTLYNGGDFSINFRAYPNGERVKRPAPKVTDADGAETRLNDKVYDLYGTEWYVNCIPEPGDPSKIQLRRSVKPRGSRFIAVDPLTVTHRVPVFATDGRPLRERETVWDKDGRGPFTVRQLPGDGDLCLSLEKDGTTYYRFADYLTHERPDSYDALWEDIEDCAVGYTEFMRRVKALAERDA